MCFEKMLYHTLDIWLLPPHDGPNGELVQLVSEMSKWKWYDIRVFSFMSNGIYVLNSNVLPRCCFQYFQLISFLRIFITRIMELQNSYSKGDIFGYISGSVACGLTYLGRSTSIISMSWKFILPRTITLWYSWQKP